MTLSVRLRQRTGTGWVTLGRTRLTPTRLAWAALGGPDWAEVRVDGQEGAVWEALNWLRCPVSIYDERLDRVWWGYVDEVRVVAGPVTVGVGLDGMANRVRVAYATATSRGLGAERATTEWADDLDSQGEYGIRELTETLPHDATDDEAADARDALLAIRRYPSPAVRTGGGTAEGTTLRCAGWWQTLDWRYYANDEGYAGFEDTGNAQQRFGNAAATTKVAQSFTVASGESWVLDRAKLRVKKVLNPTDSLTVAVCQDSGGSPGTVLDSATVTAGETPEHLDWVEVAFDDGDTLTAGTYWLTVERTGALDSKNCYETDAEESMPFEDGVMRIWNGSAWVDRATPADMPFAVYGLVSVDALLGRIQAACGDLLIGGLEIRDSSGRSTTPFFDGDRTALDVIHGLLAQGTSGGDRLLARVTAGRGWEVYAESGTSGHNLFLTSEGRLETQVGQAWPLGSFSPVGRWCYLRGVIPERAGLSYLTAASPFFVERATLSVATGQWSLEPRAMRRPWDVGMWDAG